MPAALLISWSRRSGPAARSGWPLRAAASMNSGCTHVDTPELVRVPYGLLSSGERLLVTAEAVEEHGASPLGDDEPEALAAIQHLAPPGLHQRSGLSLLAA